MTVGRVYHAIFSEQMDFFTESDKSYNEQGEYIPIHNEDERYGSGLPVNCFEWVDGTPEEKSLWDYCEENGIDGL